MDEEMENLQRNDTYELVTQPVNQKIVPIKWVYRVKSTRILKPPLVAVSF